MNPDKSNIWILTGPIKVGKTHFCNFLIEQARNKGIKLAGVICPPVFEHNEKIAISIEDLTSRGLKTLATLRTQETIALHTLKWDFDEEVMNWANQVLANTAGCDLLLVDELGPLEFNRGQGWQNGLLAIDKGDYKTAVVVIRPSLVDAALTRWPQAQVIEISAGLNSGQMRELVTQILPAD